MKTNPTGIRFDIDELEFIRKRENLKTPQSIVSFLMKEYVKMYKVEKPSVYENSISDIKNIPITDRFALNKVEVATTPPYTIKRKSIEEYIFERTEITDSEEYMQWLAKINGDPFLSEKQKQLCKTGVL